MIQAFVYIVPLPIPIIQLINSFYFYVTSSAFIGFVLFFFLTLWVDSKLLQFHSFYTLYNCSFCILGFDISRKYNFSSIL